MTKHSTSSDHSASDVGADVQSTDALLQKAGLVRNLRGNAAGVTRRVRLERVAKKRLSKAELFQAAPTPSVAPNGVHWLPVRSWNKVPWLWHGFSTRKGGVSRLFSDENAPGELNLGFSVGDDRKAVDQNRRLLAEAISGDASTPLVTARQFHSNVLVIASAATSRAEREHPCKAGVQSDGPLSLGRKADGLMTDEPGLLLGIMTADCIPILVADRKSHAVAAFHAGWRGTVKRIVETGIGRMRLQFGSRPEDLIAAIGPGIGACCYAVGEEVLSSFESQFAYAGDLFREVYDSDPLRTKYPMLFLTQRAPGHSPIGPSLHLDLIEANRRQLLAAGLKDKAIHVVGGCTSCQSDLFFSHRASQGHAGRMLGVIGIRPS
jgi:polyphenol oxidase